MSGSFQSEFGDYGDDHGAHRHDYYDYSSGSGVDRADHYGGHSGYHEHHGYHEDKCCPLVVDALCLAAILGAIAGATFLLQRTFQIELCNVAGANVNLFVNVCRNGNGRRKRSSYHRPWWHGPLLILLDGKNYEMVPCLT